MTLVREALTQQLHCFREIQKEVKDIDKMMTSATRKLKVYDLEISNLSGKLTLNSKVYKG